MHEWPLVLFTLFLQVAAGGFLAVALCTVEDARKALRLFAGLGVVSVCCSLLHLGDIFGAPRALFNPQTSWLSREVWLVALFVVSALATNLLAQKGKALLWITSILGLLAVYASSEVYATTAIPKWMTTSPQLAFFASTCILGSVTVLALYQKELQKQNALFLLLGLGIVFLVLAQSFSAGWPLSLPRALFAALGVVLLLAQTLFEQKRGLVCSALVCLVLGEFLGRYSFFME